MTFRTTLELHGKSATGFAVPPEVVDALGGGKRPPVHVAVNGHAYRSTGAPRGDRFLVPVSGEHREAAGLTAGDELEVKLTLDTEPRPLEVPPALAAALDADPVARAAFDALSRSRKQQHTLAIEGAKTDETRERRLAKSLAQLRGE
jgi:Bacteriocin-protection, YdeI or OmpD-Associated/Domain of unknown function (DUF1905)